MVSFFTAGSWEKDTIFGAAETNFRPFLFWQGFSDRKVIRIVCFGWYDCYCMYIIVIGFSKYTSRYLSDFTKYFSFLKDCQFKSGSVWFSIFQHYFFKRWWLTGNHRIQNILGQKNWGKVSISQRKIKKLSLKTNQDESVMNNSINTGISKYFVHLIMSK